jgi:NAD(P) transhydrogenase subunit alpha
MKKIHAAKAAHDSESRTPLTPESARKLMDAGFAVSADPGLGLASGFSDEALSQAGVTLGPETEADADIVIRISKPGPEELERLKKGTLHVSFLDPFNEKDLVREMADSGISAISLEMIPRSTLAQKMDVLSSQANLAGYFAVIKAAESLGKILPMMMTPAGTIAPARVFIIGVGVAGLQAIATAKRLGAQVEAFDTRPVVEEQVKSLGAKFLKIDLGETGQTDQGYAKELTPEQIQKQKDGMKKACANADIVITTAKLFGRPAPKIVDADMVAAMKRGSVIVDLAAETGGNVEGTRIGENVVTDNGVTLIGQGNLEGAVAKDASLMLSANFQNLLLHFWDKEAGQLVINRDDEIMKGCLITHDGAVVHEKFKDA